jgi:hypothetical protein
VDEMGDRVHEILPGDPSLTRVLGKRELLDSPKAARSQGRIAAAAH